MVSLVGFFVISSPMGLILKNAAFIPSNMCRPGFRNRTTFFIKYKGAHDIAPQNVDQDVLRFRKARCVDQISYDPLTAILKPEAYIGVVFPGEEVVPRRRFGTSTEDRQREVMPPTSFASPIPNSAIPSG